MKKINISIVALGLLLGACSSIPEPEPKPNIDIKPKPDIIVPPKPVIITPTPVPQPKIDVKIATGEIIFSNSNFDKLPNWANTDLSAARKAFISSCTKINSRTDNPFLGEKAQYAGKIQDWIPVCKIANNKEISDLDFWTNNFKVWEIKTETSNIGRLTSYFEPIIDASFTPNAINLEPLYEKPKDLLTIDLGDFDPNLKAKTIVGRIVGNNFVPYLKRGEINPSNTKAIAYTNMGDAISLQIQGSGRLNMDDGKQYRAIFTATNGQPFFSPAQELIKRGIFELSQASAGNVKKWFETADPKLAREVINANPRTVFYELKELTNSDTGPKGSQGVPIVAAGSLAIDPSYHPYGVPIFLTAFSARIKDAQSSITRLVVSQDSGGAIKGPIRGDLFWGTGPEAGLSAGKINHDTSWWVLLPNVIDPTIYNPKSKMGH